MTYLERTWPMGSQSKVFTDCRQSLHHLSTANKITYTKNPVSSFLMEEEHRLEECMRSNVAGSAVVICTSPSISQIVGSNDCHLSSSREMEV